MSATVEIPVARSNLLVLFRLLLPCDEFGKRIRELPGFSKVCENALTVVFTWQVIVYGWAAIH